MNYTSMYHWTVTSTICYLYYILSQVETVCFRTDGKCTVVVLEVLHLLCTLHPAASLDVSLLIITLYVIEYEVDQFSEHLHVKKP